MPASNHTLHYNLSKYAPTDNTDWLSTFNGNQDSLDNLLYQLNQAKEALQTDLDTAIAEIETLQGNVSTLQQHDSVIDSTLTSLQASVTNLTNSVTSINTSIVALNSFNTLVAGSVIYVANVTEIFKNIKKVSGVITVSLVLSLNTSVTANTTIFTLPTGFRPTGAEIVLGNQLNGTTDFYYDVSGVSGNVSSSVNLSAGTQIRFIAVFI